MHYTTSKLNLISLFFVADFDYNFLVPAIGVYIGSIAYGLVYISGLNYIYLRAKAKTRAFKISLCHLWFLLGVCISWTIANQSYYSWNQFSEKNIWVGSFIVGSTFLFGIFIGANEFLQTQRTFNYKMSLDKDVNRENEDKEIFELKPFQLTDAKSSYEKLTDDGSEYANELWSPEKQLCSAVLLIFTKIRGTFLFYWPFVFVSSFLTSSIFNAELPTLTYWLSLLATMFSTILLIFISVKVMFIVSSVIQILFLIGLTISFITETFPFEASQILLWFIFIAFGIGYSTPDILILDSASLKYSELFLTLGLAIELIPLGLIQYFQIIGDITINTDMIIPHTIPLAVILVILCFITAFLAPNNFNKTILQIRNKLNGYEEKAKPVNEQPSRVYNPNRVYDNQSFERSLPRTPQPVAVSQNTTGPPSASMQDPMSDYSVPADVNYDYNNVRPTTMFPRPRIGGFAPSKPTSLKSYQ